MISADVKEERVEWIDALNRTLEDLRKWNKDAAMPREWTLWAGEGVDVLSGGDNLILLQYFW